MGQDDTTTDDAKVPALPSRYQLGDVVRARGAPGMVSAVCFRLGKVYYEVNGVVHDSDHVKPMLQVVDVKSG